MVLTIRKNKQMYFVIFFLTHDKSVLIKADFLLTCITIKNRKYR